MNRLIAALAFASLELAANCQDAASMIAKVAARNKLLDGYHVEGTVDVYHTGGPAGMPTVSKFVIEAAGKTNKLRIEYQNSGFSIIFITDGSNIWTYMPHEKAYTKVVASAVTQDANSEEDTGQNDNIAMSVYSIAVRRYANLDRLPVGPELMGEEVLKTADGRTSCWVIETHVAGRTEKIWVDQQRYLVLRSETSFGQGGMTTHMRVFIKRFDIGPPDAAAFTFVPDKHAKLMDELNIPGARPTFVGKPAVDFALKNLDGEPVRLSEFRGKIVVLNFWATWCPPCRRELPTINKLAQELKAKDVVFLGINDEGAGTVRSFNQKNNFSFVTLQDKADKVHRAYDANAIPTVFVIAKSGIVVKRLIGGREESELIAALQAAGLQ